MDNIENVSSQGVPLNLLHKCQKLQPGIVATFISWYKLINNTFRHDLMFLNLNLTVLWVT